MMQRRKTRKPGGKAARLTNIGGKRWQKDAEDGPAKQGEKKKTEEDMQLAGVREEDAEDMVRWKQVMCSGDSERKRQKEDLISLSPGRKYKGQQCGGKTITLHSK